MFLFEAELTTKMDDPMKTTPPGDGPDAVLTRVADLLHLGRAPSQIGLAVATHPRPTSLLALVDVARQLGMKVTPAKTTAEALDDLGLPFAVHFDSPGGGGFAVVEKVNPSDVELWDSANGLRTMSRSQFAGMWSGIVVLFEADVAAPKRSRLGEIISGSGDAPAIANGPATTAVRSVIGALVAMLIALGIASQPSELRLPLVAVALLSLGGLAITSVMSIAIASYGGPFSPGICRRGRFVDCQSVLTSRFAKLFGFPLSDLGISFYAAVLLLLAASAAGIGAAPMVVGSAFVAGVPAAAILIAVQVSMRRLCTLCLAIHAVNAAGAVVSWFFLLDGTWPSKAAETFLLFGLLFAVVLLFAIPYLKRSHDLAGLTLSYGRMAGSPYGSLAQLLSERPTELTGARFGVRLGGEDANDELVAFVHPSCAQCEAVLREIRSLAASGSVGVYVAIPPKDAGERRLSEALVAIGLGAGPHAMLQAFSVAKERFGELLSIDPIESLTAGAGISSDAIVGVADNAAEVVSRSETFAAEHVEGTPMVFFNSLPYRGPIAHLITLLRQHPDLLPRRDNS